MSHDNTFDGVWRRLVDFIGQQGGEVHPSLHLGKSHNGQRGVFTNATIEKGKILIRVPHLIQDSGLSGGSAWLRCLAAFWKLPHDHPYVLSLPSSYETLWQWSNDEIETYLAGTQPPMLGSFDGGWRIDIDDMKKRFNQQILPFLSANGISATADDFHRFTYACQTLATRGFHDGEKAGPFLLPIIDLLNHSSDEKATSTHLQRLDNGDFVMYSDRKVVSGEELLHSYGELTASQFLANFGFVPRLLMENQQQTVPIVISKDELWASCWFVVEELNMPERLATTIDPDMTECWDVCLDRNRDAPFVPADIIIPTDAETPFTDELVTAACIPFLPRCAYSEITERTLLDESILDDEFLGSLVVSAVKHLVEEKLKRYTPIPILVRRQFGSHSINDRDIELLKDLLSSEVQSVSSQRLACGLAVRLEERRSLHQMEKMLFKRYPVELERFSTFRNRQRDRLS